MIQGMRYITTDAATEILGIARPTLYLWVRQGKLHPRRVGRSFRFSEDEVRDIVGGSPSMKVWLVQERTLQAAKATARDRIGRGIAASFAGREIPAPAGTRLRIIGWDPDKPIATMSPGHPAYRRLMEAVRNREFAFLGSEESVHQVRDARIEESAAGEAYLAVTVHRVTAEEDPQARAAFLQAALARLEAGVIPGGVKPFRREDLYDRPSLR